MRGSGNAVSTMNRLRSIPGFNKILSSYIHREANGRDTGLVESALAYLEADPASRTAKDEYVMRYQRFAKADLEKAIQKYEGLHETIGESEMKALKRRDVGFALAVADSLLARDQLDRALKLGQEKLRQKQVSGLKRDDLVFCDD